MKAKVKAIRRRVPHARRTPEYNPEILLVLFILLVIILLGWEYLTRAPSAVQPNLYPGFAPYWTFGYPVTYFGWI